MLVKLNAFFVSASSFTNEIQLASRMLLWGKTSTKREDDLFDIIPKRSGQRF